MIERPNLYRLREFICELGALLETTHEEEAILDRGGALLGRLVRNDDWLPDEFATPDEQAYRQYLLHCDSRERFSIVSIVWAPGQATPVHNHTVWGLIGMLRGAETCQNYVIREGVIERSGSPQLLAPGDVGRLSPALGDTHRVANAFEDRTSVSIHVYGANIGATVRCSYDEAGKRQTFAAGYHNRHLPNVWNPAGDICA